MTDLLVLEFGVAQDTMQSILLTSLTCNPNKYEAEI